MKLLFGTALFMALFVTPATVSAQEPLLSKKTKDLTAVEAAKHPLDIKAIASTTEQPLPELLTPVVTPVESVRPVTTSPTAEVKILSPIADILDVPAATVTVQFPVGSQIELQVNGEPVNPKLIGRTETDTKTHLVTQTWYGVALQEGDNTIAAGITNLKGTLTAVKVQVRGAPKQLTLSTVEARIPADGRSTATIRGQLLDEHGNRSNRDAIVTLVASEGEFVGTDYDPDQPGFQVQARQGQFTATLRSGLNAKTVRIRATTSNLEAFTQLAFETNLRPSIATGVIDIRLGARGTDFYRSFEEFLPPDKNHSTRLDVRSAVFATGRVGSWLFTGAYNSDRRLNQTCDGVTRLFRDTQFCDQNYPVYGDSSTSQVLTPSADSVYARLERTSPVKNAGTDYFMWGDYSTEEFARRSQQYSATSRQLHGFKANYNLGDLQIAAFYGNNVQGFQRDTIAPDGTSGYYFLSHRLLVPGSEDVAIELEELGRPGTVIDRQKLSRGSDYEIDYDRGTLLFHRPILRTDVDPNGLVLVRRIVTTYQFETKDSSANIYAGRVQYNLARTPNRESWLGATYLRENQGLRHFELYGTDALVSLGTNAHLIGEYAHSQNISDFLGAVGGSAYRLEAEGEVIKGISGHAYWRSTDPGFANDATTSFVPGQTRYGTQITARLSSATTAQLQYDRENNFGVAPKPLNTFEDLFQPGLEATPGSKVDNSLTTVSAGVQQQIGKASLGVDWINRHREDHLAISANSTSSQLRSRLSFPLTSNLTFQAQNEYNLSRRSDPVYPNRTLFGLDWAVYPGIDVRLSHQFFSGGQFASNSITSLDTVAEHKFNDNTSVHGRYSVLNGVNGMTGQGAVGLDHRWAIAPGLGLNLAYEHVFGNTFVRTGAGKQFAQPFAVGQAASALGLQGGDSYSVGLEYTANPDFKASARYEHLSSAGGDNTVITAAVTGKVSPSLTALVRYQQANSANQRLIGLADTANLKLGLAYRDPNNDRFNALLRYEYRQNPATIPNSILLGSGSGSTDQTFALEAIYAPSWQWEFYGKYAIRNSTSYLAEDLVGTSIVSLAQFRTTYRLGYKWDLVGEARWISQPAAGYGETGFVIEAGYYLTPNLRVAAGYAFGHVSDRDFSGSRSAGGPYLGLTVKLNELFEGFGLQKAAPPTSPPASPASTALTPTIKSEQ